MLHVDPSVLAVSLSVCTVLHVPFVCVLFVYTLSLSSSQKLHLLLSMMSPCCLLLGHVLQSADDVPQIHSSSDSLAHHECSLTSGIGRLKFVMVAGQQSGPTRLEDIMTVRIHCPAGCHAQHLLVLLVCTGPLNVFMHWPSECHAQPK